MPFVQMRQKTLHLGEFISELKRIKNANLSNHGMTHRLPDRVFTEFSFAPQAEMGWFFMNLQKYTAGVRYET